jgi:hypothetical protein
MPFIEEQRLKPDLTKILREVSETAENRYAHEVPPGYGDGGKLGEQSSSVKDGEAEKVKGKKKNRYGDTKSFEPRNRLITACLTCWLSPSSMAM